MTRFWKSFFLFGFWLFGWKVKGEKPKLKKYVIIVAPHTSNWDFIVGLAAKHIFELDAHFLGKDSLFKLPLLGWFMRGINGHPVIRDSHHNVVDQVAEMFESNDRFVMALAPEGTRSFRPEWRTGFYHIAVKASVPIVMVGLDFAKKCVELREPFYPTGNIVPDIEAMKSYYRTIPGKYPEKGVV
ncbi:MAG: 1-acyl-sn-glycerol-3-phosphate acyltransferase [Cyclobacteriaceae bacterium]|nr:1-acyl-sn-glycerol-3-phosphate acyltransferase [Cyclobacteriaceae bacterium]